jgi:hypothetical protein
MKKEQFLEMMKENATREIQQIHSDTVKGLRSQLCYIIGKFESSPKNDLRSDLRQMASWCETYFRELELQNAEYNKNDYALKMLQQEEL